MLGRKNTSTGIFYIHVITQGTGIIPPFYLGRIVPPFECDKIGISVWVK